MRSGSDGFSAPEDKWFHMESETMLYVDPKRISALASEAKERGDFSGEELGEELRKVVKLLLRDGEFRMFTEDWKVEMASAAYVSLYRSLERVDTERFGSPFNYLYTVARHALRKEAERLKRDSDGILSAPWAGELQGGEIVPWKRSAFRGKGLSVEEERGLVRAAKRREPSLRNMVGRITMRFAEALSLRKTRALTAMFKRRRESWTKSRS